ncbi:MAG TPA: transglycosylase SLT domain-containing protein [Terriglobales bacterium]|nr:transglycosylase SLT domain-containing protein [Terriglobales bacterium]
MDFTRNELVELVNKVANLYELPPAIKDGRWPDPELFAAIALKESGGNPLASHVNSNDSVDRGLWQINSVHEKELTALFPNAGSDFRTSCYTPIINALFAVAVFQRQGYKAWATYNRLA